MIPVTVESYSGYKADQRPLRFVLGEHTYEVETVDDQWYSPSAIYFRVKTNDGNVYVLRHEEGQDEWTLEAFRKK
jgi:hypothetical protein